MAPNQILEAAMLTCFGIAWPIANLRMLRTRRAEGRGLAPTGLTLCGYLAGMAAKLVLAVHTGVLAPVFWMYLLNAGSVGVNLFLQWHFRSPAAPAAGAGAACATSPAGLVR